MYIPKFETYIPKFGMENIFKGNNFFRREKKVFRSIRFCKLTKNDVLF